MASHKTEGRHERPDHVCAVFESREDARQIEDGRQNEQDRQSQPLLAAHDPESGHFVIGLIEGENDQAIQAPVEPVKPDERDTEIDNQPKVTEGVASAPAHEARQEGRTGRALERVDDAAREDSGHHGVEEHAEAEDLEMVGEGVVAGAEEVDDGLEAEGRSEVEARKTPTEGVVDEDRHRSRQRAGGREIDEVEDEADTVPSRRRGQSPSKGSKDHAPSVTAPYAPDPRDEGRRSEGAASLVDP